MKCHKSLIVERIKHKLKVEFHVLFDADWLNEFVEGVKYSDVDKDDSKGHNEGLGFEFKYTVMNHIVRGLTDGQNVEGISTKG